MVKKIIVGMGNPGPEYENTRHNIGFKVLDSVVSNYTKEKEWHYLLKNKILYIKPMVCINQTGEVLKKFLEEKKIDASEAEVLILVDELLLPLGVERLKKETNPSRHNGIRDMIRHFGDTFERLRIGIGEPPKGTKAIKYVLEEFLPEEKSKLQESIYHASMKVNQWLYGK